MLEFIKDKIKCSGCGACRAACPVDCISFETDAEGFWYPVASDKCIKCNKCEKVCPVLHAKRDEPQTHMAYAAVSKDKSIWRRSASGGAFSEICRAFGDDKTLVCGAAWDGLEVQYKSVLGVDNIAPLCKSKYVQSKPENVFKEIKNHLEAGEKAVFCGTPCSVAGLKAYLGKEAEKLLTMDLICHGVGSPAVFDGCLKQMEKQFDKKIKSYTFRAKRKVHETDYLTCLTFTDGSEIYVTKDPYIQLFLNQNALRPSCGENCAFRNSCRQGDITIADFKGLNKVFPALAYEKRNYSTIVANSEKGKRVVENLKKYMEILPCKTEDITQYNPLFARHTWSSKDRAAFFADFTQNADQALEKWTTNASVHKISLQRRLYDCLPMAVRKMLFRVFRG